MSTSRATLAMYPFGELRAAYQRWWQAVAARCAELPARLEWPDDVEATWNDDDVVVKQTCGWPLVTELGSSVRVVGAFRPDVPEAAGHRYRASIVAYRHGASDDFARATVAYNSVNSLSGMISLVAWSGRSATSLQATGIRSGSHAASLELIRDRRVELASIDAVTLAHLRRHRPDLLTGLVVVGHGPLVPSLPVITPASVSDDLVRRLRDAFAEAVRDETLTAIRNTLLIDGFEPLDLEDYRHDLADLLAS